MTISDADVKKVIDTARDTTPQIATAQLFVDEELLGTSLTVERKDQIVIYLAAHFVNIADGVLSRSKLGEGDDTYKQPSDFDQGLAFTAYGQQAMLLDTSGKLAALATNKGLKARFGLIPDQSHDFRGRLGWDRDPQR